VAASLAIHILAREAGKGEKGSKRTDKAGGSETAGTQTKVY
jgi:hypothetical protein